MLTLPTVFTMFSIIPPVPKAISSHPLYPHLLAAIRIIQFLSSLISLILFSVYISHLLATIVRAQGAVQGILAAALAYTIIATLISIFVKVGFFAMKAILIGLDLCFVVGFIVVAAFTSPMGGIARGGCGSGGNSNNKRSDNNGSGTGGGSSCGLVNGTFALAFVSM